MKTTQRRRFNVIMTSLSCRVPAREAVHPDEKHIFLSCKLVIHKHDISSFSYQTYIEFLTDINKIRKNIKDGKDLSTGISLGMRPANGRRRYIVTTSLIGWAHTKIDPCFNHEYFATM